jgi:hypothetical protein
MIAYGMRIAVRRIGRTDRIALAITMARAKPRTSSTMTVIAVISAVTPTAFHQIGSDRTTT